MVWDAFTHLDRWGMRLFPVLGQEVAGSPLYWYLQYGGSAVAAVVIAVFVVHALRRVSGTAPVVGVAALSVRDRWSAGADRRLCGGRATQRVTRWWDYWGSTAKPWEAIPTLCFGAGAGLVLGVLLDAVGVRVWCLVRFAHDPGSVAGERSRSAH
ncbi:hypothetical protein SALBM311S_12905 [Streptomyces alboniger]